MTRWTDSHGNEIDEEDRGLVYDMTTLVNRRAALGLFGGVSVMTLLAACGVAPTATTGPSATSAADPGTDADLVEVPDETGGPFPADGSNGINVLDDSGIVRSDIRSSFGSSTVTTCGTATAMGATRFTATASPT
jgi:hypothetical protein